MADIAVSNTIKTFMESASELAARNSIEAVGFIELGVDDPEGVVTAGAGTLGVDTSARMWHKATGSGNTGWVQILGDEDLAIRGGSF